MDAVSQRVLEYLTEVEEVAEDVLTTKQQVNKYWTGDGHARRSLCTLQLYAHGAGSVLATELAKLWAHGCS